MSHPRPAPEPRPDHWLHPASAATCHELEIEQREARPSNLGVLHRLHFGMCFRAAKLRSLDPVFCLDLSESAAGYAQEAAPAHIICHVVLPRDRVLFLIDKDV